MKTEQPPSAEELISENINLKNELSLRDQSISYLSEQLEWLKKQIFGKKSEKEVSLPGNNLQLEFNFEGLLEPEKEEEANQTISSHTRKIKQPGGDKISLPSDLPIKTILIDLPKQEKICKETGVKFKKIGEEISFKLAVQAQSFYLKRYVRPKYVHPSQEERGVITIEMPDSIIPKCRADESLLADIIVKKFNDHLPLYRIAQGMEREKVYISRKLLSQWVVRCGTALKPLYAEMKKKVLQSNNVFIDESPVKMQEKKKVTQGYMWVIVGGLEANPKYRIYDFKENRQHKHVVDILGNYAGILHSDKYGAYENLAIQKQVLWCPCWAHIRRKFFEAEGPDPKLRKWVLRKIKYLFRLEQIAWTRSEKERLRIRIEKEVPIIDEITAMVKERLINGSLLPKSKLRQALGYYSGLTPYLKTYTQHAYARLDNNVAERAIRPLAIGRKNWLFFGSKKAGEAGAVLLSLVQTCTNLGINPREYLEDVLRSFMGYNSKKLHELLPDQWLAQCQAANKMG